jgi:hypothetical protein
MAQQYPPMNNNAITPSRETIEAQMAHNAEYFTIGALLIHGFAEYLEGHDNITPPMLAILKPEHFADKDYARYYEALLSCKHCDLLSIINRLTETNKLQPGDHTRLSSIQDNTESAFDGLSHAQAVIDFWRKRQIKYYTDKGEYDKVKDYIPQDKNYKGVNTNYA